MQTISNDPNFTSHINNLQKSCELPVTLDLTDTRKWHSNFFIIWVEENFPTWAERRRSNIRTNLDTSFTTLITDPTDKAKESSYGKIRDLAILGGSNEKRKIVLNSQNNSRNKGVFQNLSISDNLQARRITRKYFGDP